MLSSGIVKVINCRIEYIIIENKNSIKRRGFWKLSLIANYSTISDIFQAVSLKIRMVQFIYLQYRYHRHQFGSDLILFIQIYMYQWVQNLKIFGYTWDILWKYQFTLNTVQGGSHLLTIYLNVFFPGNLPWEGYKYKKWKTHFVKINWYKILAYKLSI